MGDRSRNNLLKTWQSNIDIPEEGTKNNIRFFWMVALRKDDKGPIFVTDALDTFLGERGYIFAKTFNIKRGEVVDGWKLIHASEDVFENALEGTPNPQLFVDVLDKSVRKWLKIGNNIKIEGLEALLPKIRLYKLDNQIYISNSDQEIINRIKELYHGKSNRC